MVNSAQKKRTQASLLLSLILHVMLAVVLALVLIDPSNYEVTESLAVDILMTTVKRITPPRRMERRETWQNTPDSRNLEKDKAKAQFEPRRFEQTKINPQSSLSDMTPLLPELTTNAKRLRSKFDMPLPRAAGADVAKPEAHGKGDGSGAGGAGFIGLSTGAGIFETALYWIARNIASKNKTGKEDIVFLIDASGSMEENIAAVARYISKMIDVFKESELDYTMGVIRFSRALKKNDIKVYEQTADADQIKAILRSIKCKDDERTLDAVEVGLTQVEFRHPVDKTFILVTDERFTPRSVTRQLRRDLTHGEMLQSDFREIVKMCQGDGVKVNVLGIADEMHKSLAKETGGLWFQVPQQNGLP